MIRLSNGNTLFGRVIAIGPWDYHHGFDVHLEGGVVVKMAVAEREERAVELHEELLRQISVTQSEPPDGFITQVGMLTTLKQFSHVEAPLLLEFAKTVRRVVLSSIGRMP